MHPVTVVTQVPTEVNENPVLHHWHTAEETAVVPGVGAATKVPPAQLAAGVYAGMRLKAPVLHQALAITTTLLWHQVPFAPDVNA